MEGKTNTVKSVLLTDRTTPRKKIKPIYTKMNQQTDREASHYCRHIVMWRTKTTSIQMTKTNMWPHINTNEADLY